jgi:mannitol-specific phosphotransferase system IIBC component
MHFTRYAELKKNTQRFHKYYGKCGYAHQIIGLTRIPEGSGIKRVGINRRPVRTFVTFISILEKKRKKEKKTPKKNENKNKTHTHTPKKKKTHRQTNKNKNKKNSETLEIAFFSF